MLAGLAELQTWTVALKICQSLFFLLALLHDWADWGAPDYVRLESLQLSCPIAQLGLPD